MIVKMQKVTILVAERHFTQALQLIRKLGLVHIKHRRKPVAEGITALTRRLAHIDETLGILAACRGKLKLPQQEVDKEKVSLCCRQVEALYRNRQRLLTQEQALRQELAWFQEWGDISAGKISQLEQAQVFIKLYRCNKGALKRLAPDKLVEVVGRKRGQLKLALLARSACESLDLEEVKPPPRNQHTTKNRMATTQSQLRRVNRKLLQLAAYSQSLERWRQDLEKRLEFYNVRFGAGQEEAFCYLQGFCPQEALGSLRRVALKENWAYFFEEAQESDEVPTLIRTPRWLNVVRPVLKMMGTIPGYREYDISFWFLMFFSLFAGMLIGDAGYGLLFLAITMVARRKLPAAPREIFFLICLLSGATIFWGAISGTWFGFEKIAQLPLFKTVVIPSLASFSKVNNQNFIVHLCFVIGAIHLSLAHSIVIFRYSNSLKALSQLGWIMIVWSLFFYSEMFVLRRPLPIFTNSLLSLGLILVLIFSKAGKGIKGIGDTLSDLPLRLVSSFSDVMSYVRLFAVGFATVAMAVSANGMAAQFGGEVSNLVLRSLIVALILFIGHTINILLAIMGVLVHAVRLNLLEFSGHLDMEWSGKEYRPFKE